MFCAKSAESLENKRVEFFVNAKKCKRVRKGLKGKGIGNRLKNHLRFVVTRSIVGRVVSSKMGIVGIHPGSFRKSGKCRTYGIRNLEEYTELWRNGEVGDPNASEPSAKQTAHPAMTSGIQTADLKVEIHG